MTNEALARTSAPSAMQMRMEGGPCSVAPVLLLNICIYKYTIALAVPSSSASRIPLPLFGREQFGFQKPSLAACHSRRAPERRRDLRTLATSERARRGKRGSLQRGPRPRPGSGRHANAQGALEPRGLRWAPSKAPKGGLCSVAPAFLLNKYFLYKAHRYRWANTDPSACPLKQSAPPEVMIPALPASRIASTK